MDTILPNAPTSSGTGRNEESQSEVTDPSKLNRRNTRRLTRWRNEPSLTDLNADLEFARQENADQTANVDGWLALRDTTGKESGNKSSAPGRSRVQPKLIRKHNEWRYPGLSEPFLDSDRMFNIKPRTANDRDSARQNQMVLNWQFDTKLNKVDFIDRMVRTTVDEGTCILRTGWKRTTERVRVMEPVYDYFPISLDDTERLDVLAEATEYFITEDPRFDSLSDEVQAATEYSIENGTPVYAERTDENETFEDQVTMNQPEVKIVDVRNFFIDPSCDGVWEDAQFMIHTYESTRSELEKRGIFENLDKVDYGANAIKSKTGDPDHTSSSPQIDSRTNTDKSKVLVYEYWGLYDIHDNDVLAPIVVTWIGNTIIQMDENPFPDRRPPFVIIPYMPILKSSFGEADASLLEDNQRILGATTRGIIDLLGRSANAQTGYGKGFLDAVNRKRFINGEDFEFNPNGDPRQQIQQMRYPEIPNSALQMSQIQNTEAESLSGIQAFSNGVNGEAFGRVARGITSAVDAATQRETSILRRLGEGMRILGKKIIAMNQIYLEEQEVIRVTDESFITPNGGNRPDEAAQPPQPDQLGPLSQAPGQLPVSLSSDPNEDQFVTINRADLAGDFDLIVDISTRSVDEAKAQDLGFMLQTQGPNMDPALERIILAEIADLQRMPYLAERIRTFQPQPDPLDQQLRELQIARLEADIELDRARATEALARAENTALDTELDATGTAHERNIETAGAQARGNRDLAVTRGLLDGNTQPGNISAAVGFNQLTEQQNSRNTSLPQPAPEIPPQDPNAIPVDPAQGGIPPELQGQGLPPQDIPPQPQSGVPGDAPGDPVPFADDVLEENA